MKILLRSFVVLSAVAGLWCKTEYVMSYQEAKEQATLVDSQRQRYLSLESALWHIIQSGMDQAYVLQQIHSGHRTFLQSNFGEKNVYLSNFDPDHRAIIEAIQRVNASSWNTVDNYLHTNTRLFNEREALRISNENGNLTYHLDRLHNVTGRSDFYRVIRNVSSL